MLDSLRKWAGGWVAMIFMLLLVASFAVWGIGDVLRGRTEFSVAKVGDAEVSAVEFRNLFEMERQRIGNANGRQLTIQEARNAGVDANVLLRLLDTTALAQAAEKMGLAAPDEEVARAIRESDAFKNVTGSFDRDRFRQTITRNGFTEASYSETLREDLKRAQLVDTVREGAKIPKIVVGELYRYAFERRGATYFIVPEPVSTSVEEPDDSAVQAFYDDNPERFTAPEYREITVLHFQPQDLLDRVAVEEEDVRAAYDSRLNQFLEPETRDVQQFIFDDLEAAEKGRDRLRAGPDEGQDMDALIRSLGFDPITASLGEIDRVEVSGAPAEAAFDLAEAGIGDPVETPFGWAVFRVNSITAETQQSFEDVADRLRRELKLELARNELFEVSQLVEDERAGGATLDEVGEKLGLPVRVVDAIDARGFGPDGQRVRDLPQAADFLSRVFESGVGIEEDLMETGDGAFFTFTVDSVDPSRLKPLDEVREEAVEAWKAAELDKAAQARAEEMATRLQEVTTMEALAEEVGATVETLDPITRAEAPPPFTRPLIDDIFAADLNGVAIGPTASGGGRIVARVDTISVPDDADAEQAINARVTQLSASLQQDLLGQYIIHLKDTLGVELNPAGLEAAFQLQTRNSPGL